MKFFGQRDELFEIMAQAAARQRGGSPTGPITGPAPVAPVPTSSKHGRPSATTSTALARVGIGIGPAPVPGTTPPVKGPLGQNDLIEVDGDALVVIDDEAEIAPPPPVTSDGMRLFALRGDTAVVGGVLVAGLLFGSFLLGRSTASPTSGEVGTEEVATVPDVEVDRRLAQQAAQQAGGTGSVPASVPRAGQASAADSQPGASQSQTQAQAQGPQGQETAVTPRNATQGTQAIQVCHTSPEKAQGLAKWLNEDPRSPIFGRGDLEASAKGGSVRIAGFARQEAEVLARVQATSDPTGGSGAFRDAYWVAVR